VDVITQDIAIRRKMCGVVSDMSVPQINVLKFHIVLRQMHIAMEIRSVAKATVVTKISA